MRTDGFFRGRSFRGLIFLWLIFILSAAVLLAPVEATAASGRRTRSNVHRTPIPAGDKKPVDFSQEVIAESLPDDELETAAPESPAPPAPPATLAAPAPQAAPAPYRPAPVAAKASPRPYAPAPRKEEEQKLTGTVMLNFSDANLNSILKTVAGITGKNFLLAPNVNAKISIQTTKPVNKSDVFGIFETILDVNGLAAVDNGSYYLIVPSSVAKQHSIDVISDRTHIPSGDGMVNLIVPVEYVSSNELIQVLKPMASPSGSMVNYLKTNTLIVTDTASNLKKFIEVIDVLDVDVFDKMAIEIVPVVNVDVKTFAKELGEVFGALGYATNSTQLSVIPIERTNSVILMSQNQNIIDSAMEWMDKLDSSSATDGQQINIYYVQNDKASNLKTFLEQIFGDSRGPSTSAFGAQGGATPAVAISPALRPQQDAGEGGRGGLKIYLYEPTNALIIYSSRRDYQNILDTLKELDRPPKQVLIDALIAEIKLDDTTKYGIQWSLLEGNANVQQNTGMVSSTLSNPLSNIVPPFGASAPSGLSVLATDASRFFGVLQLLASNGKVNVLSNPHVLVKNYEKATINIGSDEPVATQSTQSAVTGTGSLIQNIEYRKTGIILTVSPQIAEGGMVAMNIRQEVSDKSTDRTVGNAVYPSFTQREAETSVVARDGELLVIGGMMQEKNDKNNSGIPFLKNIPFLGRLFSYTSVVSSKTELLILITPRVITNYEEGSDITREMQNKLGELREMLESRSTGAYAR